MSLFEAAAGAEVYLALLIVTFAMHAVLIGFVLGAAAWARSGRCAAATIPSRRRRATGCRSGWGPRSPPASRRC